MHLRSWTPLPVLTWGSGGTSYDTSQGGAAIRNAPSTQEPPQSQPGPSAGGRASCDDGDPAQAARRDGT
eukprot:425734-Rhodomonas_salina.1